MSKKWVYLFSEGDASMRELLGGKGANLAEMTSLGLPVPQGFTITTEACTQYYEDGRKINDEIQAQITEYIGKMEEITGKKFGDKENPLLVSVRSGARASMPGMMDTILNLGLNEEVVEVIAAKSGNPRWAWDCYRRFIQMYSDVVMEVGKKYFEELIDKMKEEKGVKLDVELTADDLKELANQFKAEYKAKIGSDFPSDPKEQLMGAVRKKSVGHWGWGCRLSKVHSPRQTSRKDNAAVSARPSGISRFAVLAMCCWTAVTTTACMRITVFPERSQSLPSTTFRKMLCSFSRTWSAF